MIERVSQFFCINNLYSKFLGPRSHRTIYRKIWSLFEQLKAEYPEANVELWAMDEHRLGLKPILRRGWTPVGV